jgi:hypothetical protein
MKSRFLNLSPILLFLSVVLLWLFAGALVVWYFPDWTKRGQFGDTFGAVNALFSGLAFAGLLYSLYHQRNDAEEQRKNFHEQLQELKTARELQAQPLVLPTKIKISVEKPRLYYSPPEDEHSFISRYRVYFEVENRSAFPSIGLNISASILLPISKTSLSTVDKYVAVLPEKKLNEDPVQVDFLFHERKNGYSFFDGISSRKSSDAPIFSLILVYKNALGAAFLIEQQFEFRMQNDKVAGHIAAWHSDIASFNAKYQDKIQELIYLNKEKQQDKWQTLFEKLKKATLTKNTPDNVEISLRAIPASFLYKVITVAEYDLQMREASYGQFVGQRYGCIHVTY